VTEPEAQTTAQSAPPERPISYRMTLEEFPLARWGKIMALLMDDKTKVMGDRIWKELYMVAPAFLTVKVEKELLDTLMLQQSNDTMKHRHGMRWCFGFLLAASMTCEDVGVEARTAAIEGILGIE
jgi:hypothetical protein